MAADYLLFHIPADYAAQAGGNVLFVA